MKNTFKKFFQKITILKIYDISKNFQKNFSKNLQNHKIKKFSKKFSKS